MPQINQLNLNIPVAVEKGGTERTTLDVDQLLVGAGTNAVVSKIIQGDAPSGILVTQNSTTITISQVPSAINSWVMVTGTTQTISPGVGYFANNAAQVVFTLPTTFPFGQTFAIRGLGAGGWRVNQSASAQQIKIGSAATTVGVTGFVQSTLPSDTISVVCAIADQIFCGTPSGDLDPQ